MKDPRKSADGYLSRLINAELLAGGRDDRGHIDRCMDGIAIALRVLCTVMHGGLGAFSSRADQRYAPARTV